jgi:hypothetical protein
MPSVLPATVPTRFWRQSPAAWTQRSGKFLTAAKMAASAYSAIGSAEGPRAQVTVGPSKNQRG